jgi:hypothetical protein
MGKRELLLIAAFLVAGVIVYQATAPAAPPGQDRVSLSGILNNFKRAVHGDRGSAEVTKATAHPINPATSELRIVGPFGEMKIQGEDRDDIASTLRVVSTGFDEAEAKRLAENTPLNVDTAASAVTFTVVYPREGRQRCSLTLAVPSRLRVRLEQSAAETSIVNVAGVELVSARGETTLKQIAGRATLTHRGGQLLIDDVDSLKLATRSGSEARVTRVRGDGSFDLQGGELEASQIGGAIDVESRTADVTLDDLDRSRGPLRVNAAGGTVSLKNAKSDTRVDGHNTEVEVTMAEGASSMAIYNDGGEDIRLTPPAGGYKLDAVAIDGRISLADDPLTVVVNGNEQRVSGTLKGGGPTITLRATHGNITIRAR